ncbi:MAG TPA: hypothetical protein VNW92_10555 [Polyangiaceae bacterium]|nr:hypothetical protein [Polyangiaceae bacterium]
MLKLDESQGPWPITAEARQVSHPSPIETALSKFTLSGKSSLTFAECLAGQRRVPKFMTTCCKRSGVLKAIRETRNDAIGHPTKRDHRKQGKAFISISRISMFLGKVCWWSRVRHWASGHRKTAAGHAILIRFATVIDLRATKISENQLTRLGMARPTPTANDSSLRRDRAT